MTSLLAKRALLYASAMIGQGEYDKDNDSPQIRFWREETGLGGSGPWCALWISYVFMRSGAEAPIRFKPFQPSLSAKRLVKNMTAAVGGRFVDEPEEGAVICWSRGLPWQGHVELVEAFDQKGLVTISGNSGPMPSVIKRRRYEGQSWRRRLYRIAAI